MAYVTTAVVGFGALLAIAGPEIGAFAAVAIVGNMILPAGDWGSEDELYEYEDLEDERYIRLLELLPELYGGDRSADLQCKLKQVLIDDLPHYEALSYAWSSPIRNKYILCERKKIMITENCDAALRRLRNRGDRPRLLWVDSICINQSAFGKIPSLLNYPSVLLSTQILPRLREQWGFTEYDTIDRDSANISLNTELSHQVAMMCDVYMQASGVIIWLGEGTMETDAAFNHLNIIPLPLRRRQGWHTSQTMVLDTLSYVDALRPILDRSWFERLWTIQELVMSRTPLLVCGTQMMLWDDFEERGLALVSAKAQGLDRSQINEWNEKVTLPSHLRRSAKPAPISRTAPLDTERLKSLTSRLQKRDLMLTIFQLTQTRNCADPRDRVFGFYGILKGRGIHLQKPDYTRDYSDVHEEFIRAFLKYTHSLQILYRMSEPGTLTRRTGPRTHWLHTIKLDRHPDGHISPEGLHWFFTLPASTSEQMPIPNDHDPVILGHLIGTIDAVETGTSSKTIGAKKVMRFKTKDGLKGIAPLGIRTKDIIVHFQGAKSLAIVRSFEPYHQFIGPASVEGLRADHIQPALDEFIFGYNEFQSNSYRYTNREGFWEEQFVWYFRHQRIPSVLPSIQKAITRNFWKIIM